jgi:hypothetical protein
MPKKPAARQETEDNLLVSTAKLIGTAAGKIASLAGAPPAAKSTKVGKLPKKQAHRLPRRQKKAQRKLPTSHQG